MSDHDAVTGQTPSWAPPSGSTPPPPPGPASTPTSTPTPPPSAPAPPSAPTPTPTPPMTGVPTLPPVGGPSLPPVGTPSLPPTSSVPGPPTATTPGTPPTPPPPPFGPSGELTFDHAEPAGRKRGRRAVAGIAAGVVALGAAGVFAVGQFGGGNTGGADSPEAVGEAMMAALEQEDVLGMVDLLLPGERDTFRQPMIDLISELSRLEVLSPEASLADLSGLDIEMTDEQTVVTETNVDDISNIVMTARVTASLDGDELPIGDLITDLGGDQFDPGELDEAAVTTDFELPMTVVEQDGSWYLSLFHTVAEAARGSLGEPIPADGIAPRGGDTPEGAVSALLDGVEQFDVGKIIASINPNEAAALQRYAPLFLDDVDPLLDEIPFTWQVTNTEFEVEGSGAKRFVSITSLRIDGDAQGDQFSISIEGSCAVIEAGGERFDTCELAQEQPSLDELLGETSESVAELTGEFESVFADYDQPGITVKEVDGTWYVSPIGSGFDQMLALLRALDRDELDRLIDTTQTVVDDVLTDLGSGFPLPGLDVGDDGVFSDPLPDDQGDLDFDFDFDFDFDDDDEFDDLDDEPDAAPADPPDEPALDEFDEQQRIVSECYLLDDAAAVAGCLRENIDSGILPSFFLTPDLEYPECGVSDFALGKASFLELSDAEFTSTIEAASTCFGELIANGTIDEFSVSPEYLRPECANGKNPWDFDRDDGGELFDTWLACVYE